MPTRQPSKIRVLLCDDHAVVREGTRLVLESEPDIEVVGEAADGLEAIEMVQKLRPDLVAMDVSMPRMNGIEATRRIKRIAPDVQVLALTAYDDFPYVAGLLEGGASGYLLKTARSEELIAAVRATALGESILDAKVAKEVFGRIARRGLPPTDDERPGQMGEAEVVFEPLAEPLVEPLPEPLPKPLTEPLTERETQMLRLAAKGRSNKEIAHEEGISPRTVQTHLASVFSKMGVGSRTEAVVKALKVGILRGRDIEVGDFR